MTSTGSTKLWLGGSDWKPITWRFSHFDDWILSGRKCIVRTSFSEPNNVHILCQNKRHKPKVNPNIYFCAKILSMWLSTKGDGVALFILFHFVSFTYFKVCCQSLCTFLSRWWVFQVAVHTKYQIPNKIKSEFQKVGERCLEASFSKKSRLRHLIYLVQLALHYQKSFFYIHVDTQSMKWRGKG